VQSPSEARQDQTAAQEAGAAPRVRAKRRSTLALGTRLFNPLILKLAGRRHVPLYAIIEHRGRRSGRTYTTPVAARPTADGFLIPMAFGEQADWYRNVMAAGECVLHWNGAAYALAEPEVVDLAAARPALGRVVRMLAPLFARQFVRLRRRTVYGNSAA